MVFSLSSKPKYVALEEGELPQYDELRLGGGNPKQKVQVSFSWLTLALLLCIPITSVTTFLVTQSHQQPASPHVACSAPTIRREWRTLDKTDRSAYIDAVKCLTQLPSRVQENGTAYDDFPWVHKKTAPTAHQSAPFLPWHRFYIHSYETALREQCGYGGVLPYWDWSQDHANFADAPVWDSMHGFGGDGAEGAETVGNGRCVGDGPFAGLEAHYYDDQVHPHCLSRGFAQGEELKELTELVHPDALEDLMNEPDFEKFAPELERRAHHFISHSIRGDFSKYTGPYDPVFFLHHANLDRLWSKWQQKHNANAYGGKASMYSTNPAAATDMLNLAGLMDAVPVSDVFSTTSGMFCYQY